MREDAFLKFLSDEHKKVHSITHPSVSCHEWFAKVHDALRKH